MKSCQHIVVCDCKVHSLFLQQFITHIVHKVLGLKSSYVLPRKMMIHKENKTNLTKLQPLIILEARGDCATTWRGQSNLCWDINGVECSDTPNAPPCPHKVWVKGRVEKLQLREPGWDTQSCGLVDSYELFLQALCLARHSKTQTPCWEHVWRKDSSSSAGTHFHCLSELWKCSPLVTSDKIRIGYHKNGPVVKWVTSFRISFTTHID